VPSVGPGRVLKKGCGGRKAVLENEKRVKGPYKETRDYLLKRKSKREKDCFLTPGVWAAKGASRSPPGPPLSRGP